MDDSLRELYQEVILDHGKNPRNFGNLTDATCEANGNNPLCGDKLTVFAKIDDNQSIVDVRFEGHGCAISVASASMMTSIVIGKKITQVNALFDIFQKMCKGEEVNDPPEEFEEDIDKLMVLSGVKQFPMRVKCATLAWHTMSAAVHGERSATTE